MQNRTVKRIYNAIQQFHSNQNEHGSREQQWIIQHLDNPQLEEVVAKLSIVSLHILSALQKHDSQTGIELANDLKVTRGGVTRAAKKLINSQLITANKHPDNQKKIFYNLTTNGHKVAAVHDQMHEALQDTVVNSLTKKYTTKDLSVVADFLEDLQKAENNFH